MNKENLDKEEKIIIIDALEAIKANPDLLEIMDINDEYFEQIITKLKMIFEDENLDKLIKALEIRRNQLILQTEGKKLPYPIHSGHHLRDVFTVLAVLKNDSDAEKLLENMPKEE